MLDLACAASTLVADVLGTSSTWTEEVRTRVGIHYGTGDPTTPVVCVATPAAVRLPCSVVVPALPDGPFALHVTRWWTPPRPRGLRPPPEGTCSSRYDEIEPHALLGRGDGLTPDGDDVLAGALVAGHATWHPALPRWRGETVAALATRRTTVVSRGMLLAALDGWATPELADAVEALCSDVDAIRAVERLLAVGHSSGRSLLEGVHHALATHPLATRGAA